MSTVLLVDDDASLVRTLGISLRAHGYDVRASADGRSGLAAVHQHDPDLVVVDLGLPDMDGMTVVRRIRARSDVPVIVLSARHGQPDKVAALDAGADDYLTKPFGMEELLARMRAALRRRPRADDPAAEEPQTVRTAGFTVDLGAQLVTDADGAPVRLTPTQWHLLEVLARHSGELVSQRQLLHDVWGPGYDTETNYLRVYVAQLRSKLEADPSRPRHIITEPGRGYRLVP